MIRKIIKIDSKKCNGCGLCVTACHEDAIVLKEGKAMLLRDDYCDGLGDCLPACPMGAISFEEREALPYDEAAVKANIARKKDLPCGCAGSNCKSIERGQEDRTVSVKSRLTQWPVQIKLVPVNAPYFEGADLLVAADCTAYAYGDFHQKFIEGRVAIIGCTKLDSADYAQKLSEIIRNNNIKSISVARMEVPCCSGMANAVQEAIKQSGKTVPLKIYVISVDGEIINEI